MKWVILLLLSGWFTCCVQAQEFKKYPINQTGCALYMYCNPGLFQTQYSEDSSMVYTAECEKDGLSYGVICVQLKDTLQEDEDKDALLEAYLDFLKGKFFIRKANGYGRGMHLQQQENINGILDYWQADDHTNWAIQSWTDGKFIAVLYIKSMELIDLSQQQRFFKGFLFPGMKS